MSAELVREAEDAIKRGDPDRVRDLFAPLKEKERRAVAKHFRDPYSRVGWNFQERLEPQHLAATVAWAATATARQLSSWSWSLEARLGEMDPRVADVLLSRGRGFVQNLARMLLQGDGPSLWPFVRRAVREGVIDRPEGEGYIRGMVFGAGAGPNWHEQLESVYEGLLADPELLDDVWSIFDHELGADLANTNTWNYSPGESSRGENRWLYALTRLAEEGKLDRARLLDASLDALMRDFRPSTLGWYANLHEALEPTLEERQERLERYLALVTSPAAPALKEGLAGLKELGDAVPSDQLARAATAALVQPLKTHAIAMLRELEAAVKRDEAGRPVLLGAAAQALAHEKPDVQERALKLLERYAEDAPRAELLTYLDAVAPPLRPRLEALTGFDTEREISAPPLEELTGAAAVAVQNGRWPEPRVPEWVPSGEPLAPVESLDELIELTSALLEGQGTGDDAERFLDGVSRLCDERPPRFKQRTEGLATRAVSPWLAVPEATSGFDLVSTVVAAWLRGARPVTPERPTIGGLLITRAAEVARRARKRSARPLLSFPTHAGGWVDQDELANREEATGRFRNRPDPADQAAAHYRTLSGPGIGLMPQATVRRTQWAHLEAQKSIGVVTESIPEPLASDPVLRTPLRELGRNEHEWYMNDQLWPVDDALGARWLCTLVPGYPEIQFARALTAIADFVDGSPYRHPEVVLLWMLDPGLPLRDPAWTAVAAALVAKSPHLQRAATDVVVATVSDGRFDPERLGHGIAWLLANGFGTLMRIEGPLRDAARVSPLHAAQIVRALEAVLAGCSEEQRHVHVPLGLALDLAMTAGMALESELARATAERIGSSMSRSSKAGKAAHGLLELQRDEEARAALLRLAAASAA
jgi:Family of unknown function (DUF6493)